GRTVGRSKAFSPIVGNRSRGFFERDGSSQNIGERRGSRASGHGFLRSAQEDRTVLQRSEEHTSELQSRFDLVCRLLLEKKTHEDLPRLHSSVIDRHRLLPLPLYHFFTISDTKRKPVRMISHYLPLPGRPAPGGPLVLTR